MLGKRKIRKNVFELLFGFTFASEQTPEEYFNIAYDNLICEYKNFINLLEGFVRACKN